MATLKTDARCRGESTDQTSTGVVTDEMLTVGVKRWSRGQTSEAASALGSSGVSAVMGSSDLDRETWPQKAGTKKPGHHTRLMRRCTFLSAADLNARGCFSQFNAIASEVDRWVI